MTGPFRVGDIVAIDHMGRHYLAYVEDSERGQLTVKPLSPVVTWRTAKPSEVKSLWRFAKGVTPIVTNRGGITFG